MRKVFISVPMKGMSDELIMDEIERAKEFLALVCKGEEFEYMDNFVSLPDEYDGNKSLYAIGEAIKKMSLCDVLVCPDWELRQDYSGCRIECDVARDYGMYVVEMPSALLPEARDRARLNWEHNAIVEGSHNNG